MSAATETQIHGHTGAPCASCPNTQTCDCSCNVCVLARRRVAGHICLECDEICGSTKCEDCDAEPCSDCGRKGCDGFVCPAADYNEWDDPCYDCKQIGCPGNDWCPANQRDTVNPLETAYGMVDDENLEMHYAQQEEREEEERRFSRTAVRLSASASQAQMARHAAAAKPANTVTLTEGAAAGAGGSA